MALLRCDFFSDVLGLGTSMSVILPQRTTAQIGLTDTAAAAAAADEKQSPGYPTLYLLHGLSDDDTTWLRHTSIERYASPLGLAVVMPQVHRSFYTDEAYGGRYWTFLSEELPDVVSRFFRVSPRREDTFVAGLSMGGYGAFKWALRQPSRFAAAASLSGALDVAGRPPDDFWTPELIRRLFGDRPVGGSEDDVFALLGRVPTPDRPALYLCCGTEDRVYGESVRFRDAAAAAGVPLTVDFGPGEHEWGYWDAKIQDVLRWLPLSDPGDLPSTPATSP